MHKSRRTAAVALITLVAVAVVVLLSRQSDPSPAALRELRDRPVASATPERGGVPDRASGVERLERVERPIDTNLVVKVLAPDSSAVAGATTELWISGDAVVSRLTDDNGIATYALDEGVLVTQVQVIAPRFTPYSHKFSPAQKESLRLRRATVAVIAKLSLQSVEDEEMAARQADSALVIKALAPDSSAVAGARTELGVQKDVVLTERTNVNGIVRYELDPGTRVTHLYVTAPGFARYFYVFSQDEKDALRARVHGVTVTANLVPSGTVEIAVVTESGRILANHQVSLRLGEVHEAVRGTVEGRVESPISAMTDALGKAVFEHVCMGEWWAVSYPWMGYDGSLGDVAVAVRGGNRVSAELVVPDRDHSRLAMGRVVLEGGAPSTDCGVWIGYSLEVEPMDSGGTRLEPIYADGAYVVEGDPGAKYSVRLVRHVGTTERIEEGSRHLDNVAACTRR